MLKLSRPLTILLLFMFLLGSIPTFIPGVSAVVVLPGTYFIATAGPAGPINYTVSHTMTFSSITVYPWYVMFNSTMILPFSYPTWITLAYIHPSPLTTTNGTKVYEFNYTWTGVSNYFQVNGQREGVRYRIMRNNINWSYPVCFMGQIDFTTTVSGTINIKIYDYDAGTIDTTPPAITLNFAGNHSDKGGPYYLPPLETTALSGTNLNGYYTNSSYQNESWMYINATITDAIGVSSVVLHWRNATTNKYKNTSHFVKKNNNYYEINTSVNITNITAGHKYSFDIYASDDAGNTQKLFWNKTGTNGSIVRRFIYLKNKANSIEYKLFYPYLQRYTIPPYDRRDRLLQDQGTDAGGVDTGYFRSTTPTDIVQNIVCGNWIGVWYGNTSCNSPLTLTNIYYHMWWSSHDSILRFGWNKTRGPMVYSPLQYKLESSAGSHSSVHYDGLTAFDTYYLSTNKITTTSTAFTDNDIYELLMEISGSSYPAIISNRSFTSFILFNVPSNAVLNASDTDHDTLNDYIELYQAYTNPFLQDTDGDGYNDTVEYYGGTDQNDYLNYSVPSSATVPTVVTNESTNVEETTATLNGYLVDDGGTDITSYGFDYGTTTSYGINIEYPYNISTKVASYDGVSGGGFALGEYGYNYAAQTFKTTQNINLEKIGLYLSKFAVGTSITVYLTGTTITGEPDLTNILSTGTITDAEIPMGSPIWINTSMPVYSLHTGTRYAIVLQHNAYFASWYHKTSTAYTDGYEFRYSGGAWGNWSIYDTLFRVYGIDNSTLTVFHSDIISLSQGSLYHFRAFATNSMGTSYGVDRSFVTKPNDMTGLTITNTGVNNIQSISWVHGRGYNRSVIRAKTDSYPASPETDTSIYNNTGTSTTVNNTFLLPGRLYYYRGWEYASWGILNQYSDNPAQAIKLSKPYAPSYNLTNISFPTANLSWVKGDGANTTRIVWKSSGYPTTPFDGTPIYNGTASYYHYTITNGTVYYFTAFSFTRWGAYSTYSDNSTDFTNITGGGFIINCYDEDSLANLTFNILITNPDGTQTYVNNSCVNPLLINSSLTPHDSQISIFVSAVNHHTRVYTMALFDGVIYTLNAYLPRNTTNGSGDDCIERGFIDYFIITNPAIDVLMNLTYQVFFIDEVEVYNSSTGYWWQKNYTYNTNNSIRISEVVLDTNSSMVRVTYYYMDCGNISYSYLYYFQVIVDPQGSTISNASVNIKKYINGSSTFDTISNLYTDSNGFFNIWLIPGSLYKIICNKEGYNEEIVDFIPSTVTFSHIIKMTLISTIPQPPILEPESIQFTGELGYFAGNSTYVLNLTFYDASGYTNSTTLLIYAYKFSTNTSTLIATFTTTSNQSWTYRVYNIDRNMTYTCELTYVHFYLGVQHRSYILEHQIWIPITPDEVNALFDWLGIIPFGFVNFIMWLLFVAVCYYSDSRDIGKVIIILGVIYLFLGSYTCMKTNLFGTVSAIAGGVLPAIFIAMGILIEWGASRRRM